MTGRLRVPVNVEGIQGQSGNDTGSFIFWQRMKFRVTFFRFPRVRQMRGSTDEGTAAYMVTYVRIPEEGVRSPFDKLRVPSEVEG